MTVAFEAVQPLALCSHHLCGVSGHRCPEPPTWDPKGAWVLWSVSALQGSASCTRGGQEHQPAPSLGW